MNSYFKSILRTGTYFPQSKQTQFVSMLTFFMIGHLFLPHNFQQTSSLTNIDAFVESFSVHGALQTSSYEVYAKGICSADCTEFNSYFYRFSSLTIQLELNGELSPFSGDILMHEPDTTYVGNYFSIENVIPSDAMFISQNLSSKVSESIFLRFLSQGSTVAEYSKVYQEMLYPHYGFDAIFLNETQGLIVLGYNDVLFQSLAPREKVSRMVFSTREDQNLNQILNLEEIFFKTSVYEGLIRENQQSPQSVQIVLIQMSIFLWVFVVGWFLAMLAYYWFYYGINVWSLNKTKVLYFAMKWKQFSIFLIELISVVKTMVPSALSLLIGFVGFTLLERPFIFSVFLAFLFFLTFQLLTIFLFVLLGIRFHFGKIIKRKH
jgi:hypothetical protein